MIKHDRARRLEKRVNKNVPDLIKEAEISESDDLTEVIRCPACRNRMDKTLIEELEFHVDSCDNCDMAWFDGGELAQLQLAFENKPQTVELNRMRKRLKEMTDEERAEYEERIANLRDLGSPMEQAIAGATAELAIFYWWRLGRR